MIGHCSSMDTSYAAGLVWLRRDLRLADHAALYHALKACRQVWVAFVFDTDILAPLPRADRRVEFIREALVEVDAALRAAGGPACGLIVLHGRARTEVPALAHGLGVQAVFCNADYEPSAQERDAAVAAALGATGIALHGFKDHAVFERQEVLTRGGTPYSVFTPYKTSWLAKLDAFYLKAYPVEKYLPGRLAPRPPALRRDVPPLAALGFAPTNLAALKIPTGAAGAAALLADFRPRMERYDRQRDYPALKGPSYLSVHLRFGTVSIRELARQARAQDNAGAATWLGELVWRDFYLQVLANFAHVARGASFKPEYDRIRWEEGAEADALFAAWCEGRTGYPLVDAAMLQLNTTGYMHNRLRMVTASFLCKDLGIDWRRGELYFAEKLNDFDLAANNGGWQWASSSGCDAQPYFRIFNPVSQSERFDAEGKFILRYLPQLARLPAKLRHAPWTAQAAGLHYPPPIVDHAQAREKTLRRYAVVKAA
jgi:deoxyribodipyrimidine photo-lyase